MASRKITTVANLKNLPKRLSDPLYIGRGSFWQNPYVIGKDGDREAVLLKFKHHLWNRKDMMRKLPELRGKTLLCFCSPERCHGHVLVAALAWSDARAKAAEPVMKLEPHDAHVRAADLARSRAARLATWTKNAA